MVKIIEKKDYRRTSIALLRNNEGKLLIALNPRINSIDSKNVDKNTFKFPQGGIQIGEEPFDALKREMIEELNLEISTYADKVVCLEDYVSYWFINTEKPDYEIRLYAFLIDVGNLDIDSLNVDENEIAELKWVKPVDIEYLELGIRHQAYLSIMRRFGLL